MAELLLTHSYFLSFDPKEYRTMMPYPPLGTLYAASYLRQGGISVALHDVMLRQNEREIVDAINQHQPKIVVIYDDQFNYLTKMCLSRMRQAAFELTRLAKEQGCTVVVFSSDATDHLEKYFAHGADFVIFGEAEQTLAELASHLLLKNPSSRLDLIQGLAYIDNGAIRQTPRHNLVTNLDKISFPAWDLVDIEQYRSVWEKRHGYFSLNLVTTRGCPFHCNWCAKPIYGQVYHSRSPENVVEEMKFLKQFANPDHIWFADDIFGLKPGWVTKFDEVVNRENAKIPFKCLSRVDLLLKEDNIRHLKNAGCQTVWVGAESGSQKILDAMEKGTTIEQIYEATRLLRRIGLRVGFFLQFGYPGETKEEIEQTLSMVKDCMPDEIGVSVSYPLPGTKFYERVKTQLGEKQNWVDSQDLALMFAGEYHPEFYRVLHRVVHKKFRLWRGSRTSKEILQAPTRLSKRSIRNVASMMYHGVTLPLDLHKLEKLERLPSNHVNVNNQQTVQVADAFDSVAGIFEESLENDTTRAIRKKVYSTIDLLVPTGSSILDINCGIGIDTVALAEGGYHVIGVDISHRMIQQARERAERHKTKNVEFLIASFEDLFPLSGKTFHLVLSNFGGLNCLSSLVNVAEQIARVTKPGGYFVAVVMPPISLWELVGGFARFNFAFAFRRLGKNISATGFGGKSFTVSYYNPRKFAAAFSRWFEVKQVWGLNIVSPPPHATRFATSFPRLSRWLERLEHTLTTFPLLRSLGDHYLVVLERKNR